MKALYLKRVVRTTASGQEEQLEFAPGLNIIVGEPNTGKTKWLTMIDYVSLLRDSSVLVEIEINLATNPYIVNGRHWRPSTASKIISLFRFVALLTLINTVFAGATSPEYGYPDISGLVPDLVCPVLTLDRPAAGKRVRATLSGFEDSEIYYSLYLPGNWHPDGHYPVIVEYPGNGRYVSKFGDISTGLVEDCSLGFGLSGGTNCIWICLPFVDARSRRNAVLWWGDVNATVAFCKRAVREVCQKYGGMPTAVTLCGFSRGAIACNYIGLHDDEIASLWRAFFVSSHYDGVRTWPYADSDRASALGRLRRLGSRPVFVSQEVEDIQDTGYSLIDTVNYLCTTGQSLKNFRFQVVPLRNHSDKWVLYDIPARRELRAWFKSVLESSP